MKKKNFWYKKNVLITGITGFVGSNLAKNLIENNLKNNNVRDLPGHLKLNVPKLEGVVLDYCDRNDVGLQLDELLVIEYYSRR